MYSIYFILILFCIYKTGYIFVYKTAIIYLFYIFKWYIIIFYIYNFNNSHESSGNIKIKINRLIIKLFGAQNIHSLRKVTYIFFIPFSFNKSHKIEKNNFWYRIQSLLNFGKLLSIPNVLEKIAAKNGFLSFTFLLNWSVVCFISTDVILICLFLVVSFQTDEEELTMWGMEKASIPPVLNHLFRDKLDYRKKDKSYIPHWAAEGLTLKTEAVL